MSHQKTLQIALQAFDDLLVCEKLPGLNTHAPDPGKPGLAELISDQLGKPVFVAHRLDKGTSGLILFAETKAAAAELGRLFEGHEVRKKYLCLLPSSTKTHFEAESLIEKVGETFVSKKSTLPNSQTSFRKIKALTCGDLWEALPETGKPHQIRLHAADQGLPLLGDLEHGGSPFFRLCLQAQSLEFTWRGQSIRLQAQEPAWSQDLPEKQLLLLDAIMTRNAFFKPPPQECLRLVHLESRQCRIEQYGPQWVVSWYEEALPSAKELSLFENLAQQFRVPIFIRKMQNKGQDPNAKTTWNLGEVSTRWQAQENGVTFALRTDSGQSPGLFLDQRENRFWVRQNAQGRKVLNLFSYTGGFSVCAALGGALEVCTVDVSGNFNEWGQDNFHLNGLDPKAPGTEFWNQDCLLFLKGAAKRGRKWDFILCDPPSFGRSKEGVFQIQKNIPELLDLIFSCLNPGGRCLFSTNYEQWTKDDLRQLISKQLRQKVSFVELPTSGLDFERPGTEPLMKAVAFIKN